MENIIKWFEENKICLEIFDEPKIKKAALIRNILAQLAQETCYKCRSENTISILTNENVVKLINFVSENNKILVVQLPLFDYEGNSYHAKTLIIEELDVFLDKINTTPNKFFIYNIFKIEDKLIVRFDEERNLSLNSIIKTV